MAVTTASPRQSTLKSVLVSDQEGRQIEEILTSVSRLVKGLAVAGAGEKVTTIETSCHVRVR